MLPDAIPKTEIWGDPSYHCENKFRQCDSTYHLHFGNVATGLTCSTVLFWFHSSVSLKFLHCQVSILEKREECRGLSFLSRWSFKNVSQNTRTILCITRQSRIAAWQSPGTRNRRSLIRNVGRSRANSLIQDHGILSHLTRNIFCFVNPEFEPMIDSQS